MEHKHTFRTGITSVLAMLYLVLFGMLALGFHAATSIASQVVHNDLRIAQAQLAAETGMDFMRFALHGVAIPPDVQPADILTEVAIDLEAQLKGTGNLGSNQVAIIGNRIEVPVGANNYIRIGGTNLKFRAEVICIDRDLVVKVIGGPNNFASTGAGRTAIELTYHPEERPTTFFEYGMASRGTFTLLTKNLITANPPSHASVLSLSEANPPVMIGSSSSTPGGIAGAISVLQGATPSIFPGWSVAGSTSQTDIFSNHVAEFPITDAPKLPVIDTSMYRPFATNTYLPGGTHYENIIIPPNTNPTFNGPCDIKGVVYVQQPNQVSFSGKVAITGIIVSEGSGVGTIVSNQLVFSGTGGSKQGVDALPDLPQFIGLKQLGGSFIIAPDFDVQLTGNFGNLNGHIVGDKVTLSGSTTSTINGSLVALTGNLTIDGNSTVSLTYDPTQKHVGLRFDDRYVPDPTSYLETIP